jgi:hypothetical protein
MSFTYTNIISLVKNNVKLDKKQLHIKKQECLNNGFSKEGRQF